MAKQHDSHNQMDILDCKLRRLPKKRYTTPVLTEWGSIVDITLGPKLGFQDFPVTVDGTEPA